MANANELKYKNWMVTIDTRTSLWESEESVEGLLSSIAQSYVFQLEEGEVTNRRHWQGCLKLTVRARHSTLLNRTREFIEDYLTNVKQIEYYSIEEIEDHLKAVTFLRMEGTWEQARKYCSKKETRVAETAPNYSSDEEPYMGEDINFLDDPEKRYPWQNAFMEEVLTANEIAFKTPDSRTIYWITDPEGCSGKSLFTKYICYNHNDCIKLSFGSSQQLRSSIATLGKFKAYFIDIPRTLGEDDSIQSLISVLEDLKNGYVTSTMYGKYTSLMMPPPLIVVFSNEYAPRGLMSEDRWQNYTIMNPGKHLWDTEVGDYV